MYLQLYEIKIVSSKDNDKQLNFIRSSIKNKLFKITKEFKGFKFQQNLRMEFIKSITFLRIRILMNYLIPNITIFRQ